MPFESEKHRKFMWAKHPDIARRWTEGYGSQSRPSGRAKHKKDEDESRAKYWRMKMNMGR